MFLQVVSHVHVVPTQRAHPQQKMLDRDCLIELAHPVTSSVMNHTAATSHLVVWMSERAMLPIMAERLRGVQYTL